MRAFEVTINYPAKGFRKSISDGAAPRLFEEGTTEKSIFLAETIVEVAVAAEEWISGQRAFIENIHDLGLAQICAQTEVMSNAGL